MIKKPAVHSPLPGNEALSAAVHDFRAALGDWYRLHHRRLPWRTNPSLYRTVVSELMLQQTRIETALPFFERWMTALPDFSSLAGASEEQVLKLWEGLGYYRRARNLHRLAREIIALPEIPVSAEAWQQFPGIGPYSAAAITSIAFNTSAACVDGNVVRVLARLTAYTSPLKDGSSAARLFQSLAQQMLDPSDPGSHNQAMMELGATVCQRAPACEICPVSAFCEGRRGGNPSAIPVFPARQIEKLSVVRIWAEREGSLLLVQSGSGARRLADLYELPSSEEIGLDVDQVNRLGLLLLKKKRSITRFSITERIYKMDANCLKGGASVAGSPGAKLFWIPWEDLEKITFSGPHRRWVESILAMGRRFRDQTTRTLPPEIQQSASPGNRGSSTPARPSSGG